MTPKILIPLLAIVLAGCETAMFYDQPKYENEMDKHFIDNTLATSAYNKVLILDKPPQKITLVKEDNTPSWSNEITKVNAQELPLSLVLRQIVGDKTPIKYGYSVDPSKPATFFFEGAKSEALNILALTVNYGITATKDGVAIDKFITNTYKIPTTMGEESYQIGSTGTNSSVSTEDASLGQISATGSGDGQYTNSLVDKYNVTEQIFQGVNRILSGEGSLTTGAGDASTFSNTPNGGVLGYAEVIKATSSIVVRTSPAVMKLVDSYIDTMIDDLTRKVVLEVTVIEYQQDDRSEFGVNTELLFTEGSRTLSLNIASPSLSGVMEGMGAGATVNGGRWNGSSAIINALRETGTVGVKTQQRVTASNHKTQEIDLSTIQPYISSAETTFEGSDNDIPVTTLEKSEARDGVKLLALANIQDDKVYLKLNGVLSKVVSFEQDTINGITIESPLTRQARFNTTGAYNYNETIIVTHMRQETNESNQSSQADIQVGNNGLSKVVDTLVLLTPTRVWD